MPQPDHPNVRFPPPLIFLGFLLLGLVADRVLGLPPLPGPGWLLWGLAALAAIPGLFLLADGLLRFRQVGTAPEPWRPSSAIAEQGSYRHTRNPMYLGMALLHAAIALALGSVGALVLLAPAVLAIDWLVIAREEAYLARRFGEAYETYRARVPRWL